ncbi:MAG: proline--tRNA ligase [Phycisphaerales bacterium]
MSQSTASQPVSPLAASSVGAVHRWSRAYIPTSKEAPADAEAVSHRLLSRGGFIRRVGAGIYDYLPLGWRVLQKISRIVREEMDAIGSNEMLMPALEPIELFEGTKRDVDYGDNLFRLTDRHGRVNALAPTHEEIITEAVKAGVSSYTQLPLTVYQIQTKFRDEFRPRSGLLRCREFIMKDAYSFHLNLEGAGGLSDTYEDMRRAYTNVFTRCGLDFTMVEAEAGPIGGSASHEFMVNADSGEDTILICPKTNYAANVEKCEIGERDWSFDGEPTGDLEKVHTPNLPGIDEVGKFMKVKHQNMLKTLVFSVVDPAKAGGRHWALVTVRADHDVNEGKVKAALGSPVAMADDKDARAAGFAIGYVSPRAVLNTQDAVLLVDPDAAQGMNAQTGRSMFWATGADEADHHVKHFNWRREMGAALDDSSKVRVADVRNAAPGDPSPRAAGATLEAKRGIEVGHIFKLGTKYSDAMGFQILGPDQQRTSVIMGCYGIGVSRTMAACVEGRHDDNGILWPAAIAPYHVVVTVMKPEPGSRAMQVAEDLAAQLSRAGLDVLIDDRDERPGVKFKDADLIGVPVRLTLGDKALEQDSAEFKLRADPGKGETVPLGDVVARCLASLTTP